MAHRRRRGRRPTFVVADDVDVAARRDAQLDLMADLLTAISTSTQSSRCWKRPAETADDRTALNG